MKPKKIALTGGACAGKTTAMERIKTCLLDLGYHPVMVPEMASIIFRGAGRYQIKDRARSMDYQRAIITGQLQLEKAFEILATHPKSVIITDRGTLDNKAYLSKDEWTAVLADLGLNEVQLRENYDAIIHMVTAANGAIQYYTLNDIRNETPEDARLQDKNLQLAYLGHGHHKIIGNETDFETKMHRVEQEICNLLGLPEPYEMERRFLLPAFPQIPDEHVRSLIEQTYITPANGCTRRVRKRTQDGTTLYTLCQKEPVSPGKTIEREEGIQGFQYLNLLKERDPLRRTIFKNRHCLLHDNHCMELDLYITPQKGLTILEIEVADLAAPIQLPEWAAGAIEITNDPSYSNYALALAN